MSLAGLHFEKHKRSRAGHACNPSLMDWLIRPSGMKTPEAQRPVEPSQGSGLPGIQSWKGPLELSCSLCSLRGSQERHREGQGVVGSLRLLEDVPAQVPAHLLPLGSGTLSGHSVKARASPSYHCRPLLLPFLHLLLGASTTFSRDPNSQALSELPTVGPFNSGQSFRGGVVVLPGLPRRWM